MSSTQRIWLLAGVLVATLIGYLVVQSSFQEAETQARDRAGASGASPSFGSPDGEEFASDRVLVKLKDGVPDRALEAINRRNNARTDKRIPRTRVDVVKLPRNLPVEEAIQRYEASPEVERAEPDFILRPLQTISANDPDYPKLYGLNNTGQSGGTADADVDAPEAWNAATGDRGIVVAVIDEGVDTNHPDLRNNIWTNPDETAGNGVDDDNNGYVDDINGWDFYNNDASVYDRDPVSGNGDEHGTHVAGTIAAEGNNNVGVVGVNWQVRIMPLKFLGPDGGYTSDAVEALNYALAKGVKISNNSWGAGGNSQTLLEAINRADAMGHLFVAAAGNSGVNTDSSPHYPSSYNSANIVSVAATDSKDALASFSNYGSTSVDLAAPGVSILSTLPNNTYGSYSGTSMATPHVAGVAALLKSKNPSADDATLKSQILKSVDAKSNLSGKTATGGRANAARPFEANAGPTVSGVSPADQATGASPRTNVIATFNEAMDPATLTTSTITLVKKADGSTVPSKVSYSARRKRVTLNPSVRLEAFTEYEARIKGGTSGAKNTAGNPLASDKVWSFTTRG